MSRKMIPVEEAFAAWRQDPAYVKAFNALEDEFSLARAVIARLESGRVKPSTRTLERLAAATGMRLRISFEPAPVR